MKLRVPIHAYRLVYPDRPNGPELLWEWERPSIDRLLWHAQTFGREVVPCSFVDWHALAAANQRIWDAYYRWPASEPWEGSQRWITEYRMLVATVQEVYELQYGEKRGDLNIAP